MLAHFKFLLLGSLSLSFLPLHADWEDFTNSDGVDIRAKIVAVYEDSVMIMRKNDRRKFTIKIDSLDEESQEIVRAWDGGKAEEAESGDDEGGMHQGLYPKLKAEIKAELRVIKKRGPSSEEISKAQQRVINELNAYRYLCGVPYDVLADPRMVKEATEAALACEQNGSLSHGIGHFTDKCNLSTRGDSFATVTGYVNDGGANNRDRRGHRRWCLNPPMKKTGFGNGKSGYSAMWSMDHSGKRLRESWAYPGKGFFPYERLHGAAWSLYLPGAAPAKDKLTIEVYKLSKRPTKPILRNKEPEGRKLEVGFVFTYGNTINFEPDTGKVKKGIYWVSVRGGGVRESYVVDLF